MKDENVLELMRRAEASKKFLHIETILHCVGCDKYLGSSTLRQGNGEWCDECWAKLTEGLD